MGRAEVIVVDNGSRVLPEAVVAAYPAVRLVAEPTPGPGPARNRGAALARAPLLVFADADCKVGARLAAGDPRPLRRRPRPRRPRRPGPHLRRRPGPPPPGRGLRGGLCLPPAPLHRAAGLLGDRQHGDAPGSLRRGRRLRRHRHRRGQRLGRARRPNGPRHRLRARGPGPPSGADLDRRHRGEMGAPHQPPPCDRGPRDRRPRPLDAEGAAPSPPRRSSRSRASSPPTASPPPATAASPSAP